MVSQLDLKHFAAWRDAANAGLTLPVVVDVREPWELQAASVTAEGFELLHIPMQKIPASVNDLKKSYAADHPLAILCHHGVRSQQVAHFLVQHGFTQVVNLQGGIEAWSDQLDARVGQY